MTTSEIHSFLTFHYAIVRNDGRAYAGSVHGDARDWTTELRDAFTYTQHGAQQKIASFPIMFAGCRSIRTID